MVVSHLLRSLSFLLSFALFGSAKLSVVLNTSSIVLIPVLLTCNISPRVCHFAFLALVHLICFSE